MTLKEKRAIRKRKRAAKRAVKDAKKRAETSIAELKAAMWSVMASIDGKTTKPEPPDDEEEEDAE